LQGLQRVFDICKLQAVIRQVAVKTIVGRPGSPKRRKTMPYDIYDDSGRKIGYVTPPAERAAALMLLPFMILGGACLLFLLLGGWEFIKLHRK
jgi:hypothetical protein